MVDKVIDFQNASFKAFAVALERGVAELSSYGIVSPTEVLGVRAPYLALVDEQIVVVAEAVAFLHDCVRMVEVVLCFGRSR